MGLASCLPDPFLGAVTIRAVLQLERGGTEERGGSSGEAAILFGDGGVHRRAHLLPLCGDRASPVRSPLVSSWLSGCKRVAAAVPGF